MPRPKPDEHEFPLPNAAAIQAVHLTSSEQDYYTFPLAIHPDRTVEELGHWFDATAPILIQITHCMAHGLRPAEVCTDSCDADRARYLYCGIAYHTAAAERKGAELVELVNAEGAKKGKKRNRPNKKKRKSDDHDGGDGSVDATSTDAAMLDADGTAAVSEAMTTSDGDNDNTTGDLSSITPRTTTIVGKTCFCATCLNPPTRLARLDDSDLEDWRGDEETRRRRMAGVGQASPPSDHDVLPLLQVALCAASSSPEAFSSLARSPSLFPDLGVVFDPQLRQFILDILEAPEKATEPTPTRWCAPDCCILLHGHPAPRNYLAVWNSAQGLLTAAKAFHAAAVRQYGVASFLRGPVVIGGMFAAVAALAAVRAGLRDRFTNLIRLTAPHLLARASDTRGAGSPTDQEASSDDGGRGGRVKIAGDGGGIQEDGNDVPNDGGTVEARDPAVQDRRAKREKVRHRLKHKPATVGDPDGVNAIL
ncbi:hypothetical protein Q8F55_008554 [Vanrija albida]|uniref:Uncharacterized protein n=1 Tax=Vanrija albida TaxID=181172 RepID=A0ABR3PRG1_9TREE